MITTQIATICAWCIQEQGIQPDEQDSHGICPEHAQVEYEKYKSSTARPPVKPVYAICGHIGRSEHHTCGAYACLQMYE